MEIVKGYDDSKHMFERAELFVKSRRPYVYALDYTLVLTNQMRSIYYKYVSSWAKPKTHIWVTT